MMRLLYSCLPLLLLLFTGDPSGRVEMIAFRRAALPDDAGAARHKAGTVSMTATLHVRARAIGANTEMRSAGLSDSAGIGCMAFDSLGLTIRRFAAFGHVDEPFIFDWVARIDDGSGTITGRRVRRADDEGNMRDMYEVRFVGAMDLTIKMNDAKRSIPLKTRAPARLRGYSESWPPYGADLLLEEDTVRFYRVVQLGDSSAPPFARVTYVRLELGERPTPFFAAGPTITSVRAVGGAGAGGIRVNWTNTVDAIHPLTLAGYNIYRSAKPGDRDDWTLVARVTGDRTEAIDTTYDGGDNVGYVVTHRLDYPIDFEYEGIPCAPFFLRGAR